MNKEQLFELVGNASDAYVTEEPAQAEIKVFSSRKRLFAVLAAAALLLALGISAGAAYYFSLPKDLEENLHLESVDITSFSTDGVSPQNQTVSTCGYLITFRALACGDRLNDILMGLGDGTNIVKSKEETFAIFTLEKEDGGEIDFDPWDLGYCVTMQGYDPNSLMFDEFKAASVENNVIYFACSVSDAVPFADHKLSIALTQAWPVDGTVMRMDANGDPYFMPNVTGIAAIFDLPLDPAKADPAWQAKYMEGRAFITDPDYGPADEILRLDAEFEQNGPDLSAYIGENKWRGSYPLQFGEVPYAEAYFSRRGAWSTNEIQTVSFNEAEAYIGNGAALPQNASSFTLPDGSLCYYLIRNAFLHILPDGTVETVYAPSARVIFRLTEDGGIYCLYMILTLKETWQSSDDFYVCYIDGTDAADLPFDEEVYTKESIRAYYKNITSEFRSVYDAVYALAVAYSGHEGTVQVFE